MKGFNRKGIRGAIAVVLIVTALLTPSAVYAIPGAPPPGGPIPTGNPCSSFEALLSWVIEQGLLKVEGSPVGISIFTIEVTTSQATQVGKALGFAGEPALQDVAHTAYQRGGSVDRMEEESVQLSFYRGNFLPCPPPGDASGSSELRAATVPAGNGEVFVVLLPVAGPFALALMVLFIIVRRHRLASGGAR